MTRLSLTLAGTFVILAAWAGSGRAEEGVAPLLARSADADFYAEPREFRSMLDDDGPGGRDSSGGTHPWLSYGEGAMSRVNLGVTVYDHRRLHEAFSYEWQLHGQLFRTWGLGVTLGGAVGNNAATGPIDSGTVQTGLVMASTNVDLPLGRRGPILSLGAGLGGLYVDPNVGSDRRDDLEALGQRQDQGHYWFLDERLRADLLLPLDRERHGFIGFGAVRDWSRGTVSTTLRDETTGLAISKDHSTMSFDRTTYQLSLVIIF